MNKHSLALILLVLPTVAISRPTAQSLGLYTEEVRERVVRKIRQALRMGGRPDTLSGVVTFSADGRFFIQHGNVGLKVRSARSMPAVGDRVNVTGYPSIEGGAIVFDAKSWEKTGRDKIPEARVVTATQLSDAVSSGLNNLRIVTEGRVIGLTESGFAIRVEEMPINVMTDRRPEFLSDCEKTHPIVRVTGVVELLLDPSSLTDESRDVMGVKVVVGSPDDIELELDAAYLAAKNDKRMLVGVLAVTALLLLGVLVFLAVILRQRLGLFRARAIMAERKRMADDIHDTIEQHLVGAGMLLKVGRPTEAQDVLVRAKRELRDIVWGLKNDDMMRQTPAEMLRQLAHEENTKGLYRVDTRLEGLPEKLDASAMRDMCLIVRETIGNAVKHGGAKKIAIASAADADGEWRLMISNDGVPFDPEKAPGAKDGHFGLEGIRARARRLGLSVCFEPRGKGMVLILRRI